MICFGLFCTQLSYTIQHEPVLIIFHPFQHYVVIIFPYFFVSMCRALD